ncbi:MAG: hypothetical protein R2939_02255 [Kofleriaceae bacterium]
MIARLGFVVGALVLAAACGKGREDAAPTPGAGSAAPVEVLPAAERVRAETACDAFVAQVCGCAERDAATWADRCHMAKAMPQALELSLDVAAHPDTTAQTVGQLQRQARKLAAKCIEDTAALAVEGCR